MLYDRLRASGTRYRSHEASPLDLLPQGNFAEQLGLSDLRPA